MSNPRGRLQAARLSLNNGGQGRYQTQLALPSGDTFETPPWATQGQQSTYQQPAYQQSYEQPAYGGGQPGAPINFVNAESQPQANFPQTGKYSRGGNNGRGGRGGNFHASMDGSNGNGYGQPPAAQVSPQVETSTRGGRGGGRGGYRPDVSNVVNGVGDQTEVQSLMTISTLGGRGGPNNYRGGANKVSESSGVETQKANEPSSVSSIRVGAPGGGRGGRGGGYRSAVQSMSESVGSDQKSVEQPNGTSGGGRGGRGGHLGRGGTQAETAPVIPITSNEAVNESISHGVVALRGGKTRGTPFNFGNRVDDPFEATASYPPAIPVNADTATLFSNHLAQNAVPTLSNGTHNAERQFHVSADDVKEMCGVFVEMNGLWSKIGKLAEKFMKQSI